MAQEKKLHHESQASKANDRLALVAEAVQEAAEANYRAIFDAANDAIFVHDMHTGAIIDVNHKMTEMYGYTPEEARRIDVEAISAGTPPYTLRCHLPSLTLRTESTIPR